MAEALTARGNKAGGRLSAAAAAAVQALLGRGTAVMLSARLCLEGKGSAAHQMHMALLRETALTTRGCFANVLVGHLLVAHPLATQRG